MFVSSPRPSSPTPLGAQPCSQGLLQDPPSACSTCSVCSPRRPAVVEMCRVLSCYTGEQAIISNLSLPGSAAAHFQQVLFSRELPSPCLSQLLMSLPPPSVSFPSVSSLVRPACKWLDTHRLSLSASLPSTHIQCVFSGEASGTVYALGRTFEPTIPPPTKHSRK